MADTDTLFANPIAHRGLHDVKSGLIENCEGAFTAAIDAGFAIECDVQLSSDNQVIVFHDYTLDRLMNTKGEVHRLTVSELKNAAFKDGQDKIQTLQELLEQVAGKVPLIIELKSRWNGDEGLALRVAETIGTYTAPVATMSFDPVLVAATQRWLPYMPNGIVSGHLKNIEYWKFLSRFERYKLTRMLHWRKTRPDFISYNIDDLPSRAVSLMENLMSVPVICWTVRTQEQATKAAEFCEQITFEGFDPRSAP